jgi:Fe-S-cluster containining protein
MAKELHDFWHFSRRYRQFQRISALTQGILDRDHEVSGPTRKALQRLNANRISCHERIARLDLPSFAGCQSCRGACCGEPAEHYFTAVDFWLRKYSHKQVTAFSEQPLQPIPAYYRLRIESALAGLKKPATAAQASHLRKGGSCAHLGERGCLLPHAERPLKCLIYACPSLKESLDQETRRAYIESVRELLGISLATFNALKCEAGLPPYYGLASLLLTL